MEAPIALGGSIAPRDDDAALIETGEPVEQPLAPEWLRVPRDANALAASVWPGSAERVDGELRLGGIGATKLARRYGTPLLVLDEGEFRWRAHRIRHAFQTAASAAGTSAHLYYAGKAFLSVAVARWATEAGLRVDVASGGELAIALAAGVAPPQLGLHGNNKSLAEIDRAVGRGVGAIILDSVAEIDRVADAAARHGRVQRVRLRINSGVHASTHEYLATASEDQKFGVPIAQAPDAVAAIRARPELRFLGLHSHLGSQIFGHDGFGEAARRLLALHAGLLAGGEVPELNLGGGFGVAYTDADEPDTIEQLASAIVSDIAERCAALGIPVPVLAFEPGRWIAGPAGVTLYELGTVKDVPVGDGIRRYLSVDGGMSDNIRPALYGADYSVRMANRASDAPPALVRVVGKHCESGDIVVRDDYLPGDTAPGDLLAVPVTGAYCHVLASNYNALPRPAVVAVNDGAARVLIRRESEAELLARDLDAAPASPAPPEGPSA